MGRDEVLRILREHRSELASWGVRDIALFGSLARREERPDSDVDILVDFSITPGLFAFVRLKARLEALLGRRVDLVTEDALKPALRERILREAVHAA